jgi:hypothetical protein
MMIHAKNLSRFDILPKEMAKTSGVFPSENEKSNNNKGLKLVSNWHVS